MKSIKELHDEEQADARNAEAVGRWSRQMDKLADDHAEWHRKFDRKQKWLTSAPLIVLGVWIFLMVVILAWKLIPRIQ